MGGFAGVSGWDATPGPEELPDWRIRLCERVGTTSVLTTHTMVRLEVGGNPLALLPYLSRSGLVGGGWNVRGRPELVAAGARVIDLAERRRLSEAELFWADSEVTALAVACAADPPREPVKAARMPAEAGLMVFADPIHDRTVPVASVMAGPSTAPAPGLDPGLVLDFVVTAVSWSAWRPGQLADDTRTVTRGFPGARGLRWTVRPPSDAFGVPLPGAVARSLGEDWEGVWLTFWGPGARGWERLDPDLVVGSDTGTGTVLTAADMAARDAVNQSRLFAVCAEHLLPFGQPLPPALPDTTNALTHVVYTAWQLMNQTGTTPLAGTELLARDRHGRRRDTRNGITTPGDVHLIHVRGPHPIPDSGADQGADTGGGDGREEPRWTHRWPVRPHRRNHCLNPHAHAHGGCEHDERIIPAQIRGPADKPLRIRDRVHIWDTPPPDTTTDTTTDADVDIP